MQATVRSYDAADEAGTVFTDDGTVLSFGPAALAGSGLRLLRRGQRVRIRLDEGGAISALTLATFPLPPRQLAGPGAGPAAELGR